ncbi:MAG: tyrosine-type recombinase/integrase [Lachnospiraceae bacterium]|nr:tyrosine-type recombinase/integrase [Lachnospiraceae bacterium]
MEKYLNEFIEKLKAEGKSENTIKSYALHMEEYFKWFSDSFGNTEFKGLYRANIQEYKNYLKNIKRVGKDNHNLNGKTINAKLSALSKYNSLMQPDNIVISKADFIKIQENAINPTEITKDDVEAFRQRILQSEGTHAIRNYTIVTILMYTGMRISEVLGLNKTDVNTITGEIRVSDGKGEKQRIVIMNSKVIDAINEYKRHYNKEETPLLFYNAKGKQLDRTAINKVFWQYRDKDKPISPHSLRHYWCSSALEAGYTIAEVAMLAGHSNIHTTMKYTNPTMQKIKERAELL